MGLSTSLGRVSRTPRELRREARHKSCLILPESRSIPAQPVPSIASMQDPSHAVPLPLLQHVHLVSTMPFPHQPSGLPHEVALQHLQNAPRIVRQMRPVRWEYWQAPPDGKIALCWQPQSQLGNNFATDGYVWAEPEAQFSVNVHGWVRRQQSTSARLRR